MCKHELGGGEFNGCFQVLKGSQDNRPQYVMRLSGAEAEPARKPFRAECIEYDQTPRGIRQQSLEGIEPAALMEPPIVWTDGAKIVIRVFNLGGQPAGLQRDRFISELLQFVPYQAVLDRLGEHGRVTPEWERDPQIWNESHVQT